MVSGGAPLNKEVMDFFKVVFRVPFLEAYGQTEGTGAEFSTFGFERFSGTVGSVFEHMEFKLVDVPEMDYYNTDKDEQGNPTPRGELWVRGPSIIKGYYKMPEKDKELMSGDWMMSGDIVMLTHPNKSLKIIDRKKHIFKLSQGEYVAPEKLENIYKSADPLIANVYIYGNSNNDYIVGAINIELGQLKNFAKKMGVGENEGLESEALNKAVLELLEKFHKDNKLNGIERVRKVILSEIDW